MVPTTGMLIENETPSLVVVRVRLLPELWIFFLISLLNTQFTFIAFTRKQASKGGRGRGREGERGRGREGREGGEYGSTGVREYGSTGEREYGSTGVREYGSTGVRERGREGEGKKNNWHAKLCAAPLPSLHTHVHVSVKLGHISARLIAAVHTGQVVIVLLSTATA